MGKTTITGGFNRDAHTAEVTKNRALGLTPRIANGWVQVSKAQIWEQLYKLLNFNQYTKVANSYGKATDGLPNHSYDTYFKRTLKITRNKKLINLAIIGLGIK